jgi:hypothetical protein
MMKKITLSLMIICCFQGVWAQVSYLDTVFTNYFRRTSGWTAGDATISVPLKNGEVAWLFGDSYIDNVQPDQTVPCLFQVRNCMVLQDLSNLNSMTTLLDNSQTGIDRTPFKLGNSVDTTVFWPNGGYVDGDTAIMFFSRFRNSDLGLVGNYVVHYVIPSSTILSLELLPVLDINYLGNGVIYDSISNYLYLYGSKVNWIVFEPYVVRVQADDLFGTYEYYAGNNNWSANPGSAQKINSLPVSPGYSVFPLNGKYYLVTQQNGYLTCGLGLEIYAESSTQPYGPFGNRVTLYTIDDVYQGDTLITYNATAHPEFIQSNELLISYNVNGTVFDTTAPHVCPSPCENVFTDRMPADLYRPKFVRVPLELIDASLGIGSSSLSETQLEVYPNPFVDGFSVRIPEKAGRAVDLEVRNVLGEVVLSRQVVLDSEGRGVVEGVNLPFGVYWVFGGGFWCQVLGSRF